MAAHYLNQGYGNMNYQGSQGSQGKPNDSNNVKMPSDFFNFKGVNPEILNLGISAGQASIDRVVWQVWPGMSNFWNSLKTYFAVF